MSNMEEPSTSSGNELNHYLNESNTTFRQQQCLILIRDWLLIEAEFRGRTDEEFLLKFLRGCKFDLEKTKKKITAYYANWGKFPKWLANRDLRDENIRSIIQLIAVPFDFDDYIKAYGILLDVIMRRPNSQLNGVVTITDCQNHPWWLLKRFLSPFLVRDLVNTFMLSTPLKLKGIHVLKLPTISSGIWTITRPFLGSQIRDRVHFYHSDWSKLFDHVPLEAVPEEYGGLAGPLKKHEDAFLEEVLSHTEYFLEDDEYGFKRAINGNKSC